MRRNLYSILLLLCVAAPVAATLTAVIALKQQQWQLKGEVKRKIIAGLHRSELVLLSFTEAEKQRQLDWEYAGEFEYKGEMYDVVATEVKGDSTFYWCWEDREESLLNQQLEAHVAAAMGSNRRQNENQERLFKFFKILYFPAETPGEAFPPRELQTRRLFRQGLYLSFSGAPPEPPPRLV